MLRKGIELGPESSDLAAQLVIVLADQGELRIRVSDEKRKPLPGFGYGEGDPFKGDSTAHEVLWKGRSMDELKGRTIRLEFQLRDADLFTFRARP